MAGGPVISDGIKKRYPGRTTPYVCLTCFVAAFGGALFGYDLGVTGGIVSMQGFLEQFFPEVWDEVQAEAAGGGNNRFCKFDNQGLQWFTSSMFIAGTAACIPAGWITRRYGRKFSMLVSGILFDAGVVLITAAWSLWILILARILLGFAIAFASVSVTLFNSEMAPAHIRGRLNQLFQLVLAFGVLLAQAVNIGTTRIYPWGWRLSMAIAGVPSIVLTLGGIFLPDTPNSLLERGRDAEARRVLVRVRGTEDVDEEFEDIRAAVKQAAQVVNPYRTILKQSYRPQLFIPISIQFFHQWSGINTVTFFAPELFVSLGMPQHTALIATVVIGAANHLAVYVAIWAADEFGRRFLLIEGGIQMAISLVIVAAIIATAGQQIVVAWITLIFLCSYTVAFNWSWAPVCWLYASEVQPLETRAAGQSIASFVYLLFAFVIGQTYLSLLCAMRWGLYIMFAALCLLAAAVTYLLYPETKGLALEEAPNVFRYHWFWQRYCGQQPQGAAQRDQQLMHLPSLASNLSNGSEPHASMELQPQTDQGLHREAKGASQKAAVHQNGGSQHRSHEPDAGQAFGEDGDIVDLYPATGAHMRQPASDDPYWNT